MSETKHTPGPWEIDAESNAGSFEIWGGPIEDDAPLICSREGETLEGAQEAKANARLIAAAPDLLEAAVKTINENLHLADGDNCTLKYLKDAVAKATGQDG